MAARCRVWVCDCLLAGTAGSNTAGGMDVCLCNRCMLSGRGVCVGMITRHEESYQVQRV